jgi:DNA-binding winged helix-turn-helix (wHTH) protein/TolB-like protein
MRIGRFVLDQDRAELSCDGTTVSLRPKTFALLVHLAAHAGNVVGKQELLDAVWPGLIVTDDSLTQAISELRSALDDREQKLIRTLPRRGYRLDDAEAAGEEEPAPTRQLAGGGPTGSMLKASPARTIFVRSTVGLIGVLLIVALAVGMSRPGSGSRIGAELAERRSLAVMPFTDLSEPPAPHLAQAVDMDLTTDLGRLADTRVMARASAAMLGTSASVDIKRVGRELDVRHLVTGSVRRDGEQLHITVQLARSDTGALLWTERFDYASAADWVVHRDVSGRIASLLGARVHDAALERARQTPPNSVAVDRWMRGSYLMSRIRSHADLLQARADYQAALAAQPDSPQALSLLGATYVREVAYRWAEDGSAALVEGERLARQALEIDPNDQLALSVLGSALMFNDKLDKAMVIARRQLVLNPNDSHANRDLASVLYFAGRWEEALRQLDVALRLNPLDPDNVWKCRRMAATSLIALHRYDEAIEQGLAIDGPFGGRASLLASAEALRGNLQAARQHAAEMLRQKPDFTIARDSLSRRPRAPAFAAGKAHFDEGLRRAGLPDGTAQRSLSASADPALSPPRSSTP